MAEKTSICFSIACVALLSAALMAQERQPGSDALTGLRDERGVYYRTASGWVGLPITVLMPFYDGTAKQMFGAGPRDAVAAMPGAHAAIRIANARPTFYLRGFSPGGRVYLVQGTEREDYRELRMTERGHFPPSPRLRATDMQEIELAPAGANVVTIKPHADLKPGEYAILSVPEPRYRWIHLAFAFGVSSGAGGAR